MEGIENGIFVGIILAIVGFIAFVLSVFVFIIIRESILHLHAKIKARK